MSRLPTAWADEVEPIEDGRAATALNHNLNRWGVEVRRQTEVQTEFASRFPTPLASVMWMPESPVDLESLGRLVVEAHDLNLKLLGI